MFSYPSNTYRRTSWNFLGYVMFIWNWVKRAASERDHKQCYGITDIFSVYMVLHLVTSKVTKYQVNLLLDSVDTINRSRSRSQRRQSVSRIPCFGSRPHSSEGDLNYPSVPVTWVGTEDTQLFGTLGNWASFLTRLSINSINWKFGSPIVYTYSLKCIHNNHNIRVFP